MGFFGFGKRKKQIIAYQDEYFSLMHKQQYAEAVAVCEQLLKLEYGDARGLMGDAYRAMGDEEKMIRMYQEGLRKASSATAYRSYAEYLLDGIGPAPEFCKTTGYAECIDFGEKAEEYLKKAKDRLDKAEDYLEKAGRCEELLIGDAAIGAAARKRSALKRKYNEAYDMYRDCRKELERIADEISGHAAVRRAVNAAPKDLIKGMHPFRVSEIALHSSSYACSANFKIDRKDIALEVNIALKEDQTFQEGFAFTAYGVASHYFTSVRNMMGKSNFWDECAATLPYHGLTEVEQDEKYVICRYSDRKDIIVLAGDHAAWLCRVLQNLIDVGYTRTAPLSPFLKLSAGKP